MQLTGNQIQLFVVCSLVPRKSAEDIYFNWVHTQITRDVILVGHCAPTATPKTKSSTCLEINLDIDSVVAAG